MAGGQMGVLNDFLAHKFANLCALEFANGVSTVHWCYSTFTLRSQFIGNSSVEFVVCDVWNFVPK